MLLRKLWEGKQETTWWQGAALSHFDQRFFMPKQKKSSRKVNSKKSKDLSVIKFCRRVWFPLTVQNKMRKESVTKIGIISRLWKRGWEIENQISLRTIHTCDKTHAISSIIEVMGCLAMGVRFCQTALPSQYLQIYWLS